MKKIFLSFYILFISFLCFTSCKKDNQSVTADVFYMGVIDSIVYSDPADSVWDNNIQQALREMKITYSAFEERDTLQFGIQAYAIHNCNVKASASYDKLLKNTNLSSIKKQIFDSNKDSLINLGYNDGADNLPIDQFNLYTSVWSLFTDEKISDHSTTIY